MGTLFAGIIRAPMTSVFMIFEITQDYQILVPLMVANLLSFTISKRYQPTPLYHALLHQDGVHLPSAALQDLPEGRTAADLMARDTPTVPETAPIAIVLNSGPAHAAFIVGDHERVLGVVGRERVVEAAAAGLGNEPVASLLDPARPHVHPDHPFETVLSRFSQANGVLPVVSRTDATRIEGVITLDSMVAAVDPRAHKGAPS
jgi:CIC family chloride channel protein